MNNPGVLLSFDGIDSSGKATQTRQLAGRLRDQGFSVVNLQSPDYATPTGQRLKALLQKPAEWSALSWEDKMVLFAENRTDHRAEVIGALERGDIVIYDRYVPSSMAFMTVEALLHNDAVESRESIQQKVADVEYGQNQMPKEHLSVFLDLPPRISASLLEKRKEKRQDKDEYTDHLDIQQRLYAEYDLLCTKQPDHYVRIQCFLEEHLLGVADVAELVWVNVIQKFPHLKKRS